MDSMNTHTNSKEDKIPIHRHLKEAVYSCAAHDCVRDALTNNKTK